jgi:hypothetical protein
MNSFEYNSCVDLHADSERCTLCAGTALALRPLNAYDGSESSEVPLGPLSARSATQGTLQAHRPLRRTASKVPTGPSLGNLRIGVQFPCKRYPPASPAL